MTERLSSEDTQKQKEALLLLELYIKRMALFATLDHPTPAQTLTARREAGIIDGEIKRLCEMMPPIQEVSGK